MQIMCEIFKLERENPDGDVILISNADESCTDVQQMSEDIKKLFGKKQLKVYVIASIENGKLCILRKTKNQHWK